MPKVTSYIGVKVKAGVTNLGLKSGLKQGLQICSWDFTSLGLKQVLQVRGFAKQSTFLTTANLLSTVRQ